MSGRESLRREAARLAADHALPAHLALMVADGRLELKAAILQKNARRRRQRRRATSLVASRSAPKRAARWSWAYAAPALLVLLALTAAAGIFGWSRWQTQLERSRQARALAEARVERPQAREAASSASAVPASAVAPSPVKILTDDAGRLLVVRAPNPQAVLTAFCEAWSIGQRLVPLELASSRPAQRGVWLGLYRDPADVTSTWAIRIRQERGGSQWVAGDGIRPLEPFVPDPLRLGDRRVAVVARSGV